MQIFLQPPQLIGRDVERPLMNEEHNTFEGKDKELSEKEKLPRQQSKLQQHIQPHLSQVSESVKNLTNALWQGLTFIEDIDLQETQHVYHNIARFLQEKLQADFQTCLQTTYLLCNESDPQIIGEQPPSKLVQKLATKVKDLILTIKVHYLKPQAVPTFDKGLKSKHLRQIEIFYINPTNPKPNVVRFEEEVEWDNLPSDVRETFIKEDPERISFRPYPQGD